MFNLSCATWLSNLYLYCLFFAYNVLTTLYCLKFLHRRLNLSTVTANYTTNYWGGTKLVLCNYRIHIFQLRYPLSLRKKKNEFFRRIHLLKICRRSIVIRRQTYTIFSAYLPSSLRLLFFAIIRIGTCHF